MDIYIGIIMYNEKEKDPAFLFYFKDFLEGSNHMTTEQVGMYILCLCYQAGRGTIRINHLKRICNNDEENIKILLEKFKEEASEEYYNERLRKEQEKRKNWVMKGYENLKIWRKNNGIKNNDDLKVYLNNKNKLLSQDLKSENENEDENENENEIINNKNKLINNKYSFGEIWNKYPNKDGKKAAERSFKATVKNNIDWNNIHKALNNYLNSERVKKGYIKNGSTWFANWTDWLDMKQENISRGPQSIIQPVYIHPEPIKPEEKELLRKMISDTKNKLSMDKKCI